MANFYHLELQNQEITFIGDVNNNIYYLSKEYTYTKNENTGKYVVSKVEDIVKKVNKEYEGITITKDETNLDKDKVDIKLEIPEGVYSVKLPNGNIVNSSTTITVTENGEYTFEFTDSDGKQFIRVVHVTNIQRRKETKIPKVSVINGKVELESDDKIEYSVDEKSTWNEYTEELTYTTPIYVRVVNENYECSILKITIDENGKLSVLNEEARQIQGEILTNAIGRTAEPEYDYITKAIKISENVAQIVSNTKIEQPVNLFNYISRISDSIIYAFSATDGQYAGCYNVKYSNNITEIGYKDLDNNIKGLEYESSVKDIAQTNSNIDYAIIKDNYALIDRSKVENIEELTDEQIDENAAQRLIDLEDDAKKDSVVSEYVKKQAKDYAYIDNNGNLISNIEAINIFKSTVGENTKYVKIVGDGEAFYILTQEGEVYLVSSKYNEINVYFQYEIIRKKGGDINLATIENDKFYIYKLRLNNIINIFDTCTAQTKDGGFVSLLYGTNDIKLNSTIMTTEYTDTDTKKPISQVQLIQKQVDKYLMATHLGLKDGKLYDFSNINNGVEVPKGKLVKNATENIVGCSENGIIYLFDEDGIDYYNNLTELPELPEGLYYIGLEAEEGELPEFADIAEYKDDYLTNNITIRETNNETDITQNYDTADKTAKCYAVGKDGQVYLYFNGYVIDLKQNLDFYGPTVNYSIDNSNWTNENINLELTANTTNEIVEAKIEKDEAVRPRRMSLSNSTGLTVQNIDETLEIATNGIYNYSVTDAKGRSYTGKVYVDNIDKLNPNSPEIESVNGKLKITFNEDTDATDDYGKSGIKNRLISFDGENWVDIKEYDGDNLTIISENVAELSVNEGTVVYAKAVDNAGNESDIVSGSLVIERGTLTVKYLDEDGNALKAEAVTSEPVGTTYNVSPAEIEHYHLLADETEGETEGVYVKAGTEVIFHYAKDRYTVRFNANFDGANPSTKDQAMVYDIDGSKTKLAKNSFERTGYQEIHTKMRKKFQT